MDGLYIPQQPIQLLSSGNFSKVPLLIGTNTDEGTYFTYQKVKTLDQLSHYMNETMPFLNSKDWAELRTLYPLRNYDRPYLAAADMVGDRLFHCPSHLMSRTFSSYDGTVYKYRWNHQVLLSKFFARGNSSLGVFHFSEVPFVFDMGYLLLTHQEALLAKMLSSMWIQFITQGDPNLKESFTDESIYWPKYQNKTRFEQMLFQVPLTNVTVEEDRAKDQKCSFWLRVGRGLVGRKHVSHIFYRRSLLR
jgi:carboxylesterase type B